MCKIKILDSNKFINVNNIYCVGKNYFDHIKEFGSTNIPEEPIIFLKPNSAIIGNGDKVIIPEVNSAKISNNLHYEVELVVIISKSGENIPENKANEHILGYAVGLDMTLRDIQAKSKKDGTPWALSKGFKTSCPVSEIVPQEMVKNPMNLDISLSVNGTIKQFTNTSLMINNINKLISYISSVFSIKEGDILFTGTPSGVSKTQTNDVLLAKLNDLVELKVTIG